MIDFEVVHFGDPSFDAAFCLNHLVLKWFCLPTHRPAIEALMAAYWPGLLEELPSGAASFFEGATLQHLGCLMLARVDGKSPVEYLHDEQSKTEIRGLARELIFRPPAILDELMRTINRVVTR